MSSRSEQMISPRSSGAGRMVDWMWPDPLQLVSTAASNTQGRNRLMNVQTPVATGGFGGGGATVNVSNSSVFGTLVNVLAAGGADGVGQIVRPTATTAAVYQMTVKQGVPTFDYQDLGCARVYGVYALSAFGGGSAVADCGLEVTTSGGLIQSQSTAGIGFGRSAAGLIISRCQTVGGGASTNTVVTGPGTAFVGFNEAILHTYELQFTSATATAEAGIRWLIDGISVRALSYGAGTILPNLQATTATAWTCMLVNVAANVAAMSAYSLRIIQAPTIADCF